MIICLIHKAQRWLYICLHFTGFSKNSTTWLPVHSNYKSINVKALKSADRSHLHHFQELASLRNHPTIIAGNITLKAPEEYTLVFTRYLFILGLKNKHQH